MKHPKKYSDANTLREKISYLISIMEKGSAPELAMEIAEMDGVASEKGLADLTISLEQELHKMSDEGIIEKLKEHRQKVRYALPSEGQ